jgi:hypothetical protein
LLRLQIFWQRKQEASLGQHVLSITTICMETSEASLPAQVFESTLAEAAVLIGAVKPGDAYSLSYAVISLNALSQFIYLTDYLVSRGYWQLGWLNFALNRVQVGMAYPACLHLQADLVRSRFRYRQLL